MTPVGWAQTTLGELAVSIRNGLFSSRPNSHPPGVKILRISAVRGGRVDLDDAKYVVGLDGSQVSKFSLNSGDLLVTRYNGSRRLVGTSGIVPDHGQVVIHPDKLIRVVLPAEQVDAWFLNYQMASHGTRQYLEPRIRTTAGQSGVSGVDIRGIPIVLPELSEQRRIVDILEDHLSRLDAAHATLRANQQRLESLRSQLTATALLGTAAAGPRMAPGLEPVGTADGVLAALPSGWSWHRLGELAEVVGGVTKDAKRQADPSFVEVPYLRVANVQRGRLDLAKVTTIRVPAAKAEALRLRRGDVLMNEGGDRDKLARGWVWEGQVEDCIHQNHVFRARVRDGVIDPYILAWAANTMGGQWAERNGKQSVNLASISLSKIRLMPVPVPPLGQQAAVRDELSLQLARCQLLEAELDRAATRSAALRRALLAAAFSGRLTGRSTDTEVVEELAATGEAHP